MVPAILVPALAILAAANQAAASNVAPAANYTAVCAGIATKLSSSSHVYWPGSPEFTALITHSTASSSEVPACVLEPGSNADVGKILKGVGQSRTPFAVQSGGHSFQPGFSSTKAVHVSLNQFKAIKVNAASGTVDLGPAVKWEEAYAVLEKSNTTVLGGRIVDIGVGGLTLGGGYAWQTNQHGLTIDTVTSFELVKANGELVKVTQQSDSQLFFGLKGGLNNFGIVTKLTLKTYPQGQVWGGGVLWTDPAAIAAVGRATSNFATHVTDPKASLTCSYTYAEGKLTIKGIMFYDGPAPPAGIFDDLLAIQSAENSVKSRSYLDFINDVVVPGVGTLVRSYFTAVSVPAYSPKYMEVVANVTASVGAQLASKSLIYLNLVAEPFFLSSLSHSNSGPTAFPWTRSQIYTPFALTVAWQDEANDQVFKKAFEGVEKTLYKALAADGFPEAAQAPLYPNYAINTAPIERIYGSNLPALKALKRRVDPTDVLGLTGGFKIKA